MTTILKPVYVVEDLGEFSRLPDGAIINIGGVAGPTFTVGGRGLLFDDGSSTSATPGTGTTLQVAYGNSLTPAQINTTIGKDIVFNALNNNKFIFDASTGTVIIQGNLNVLGTSNVVEGTVSNLDQVNIQTPDPSTIGFTIQPMVGITPVVNLVDIKAINGGPTVFSIGPTGTTSVTDILISGTVNGTPISEILDHLNAVVFPAKHTAAQISANTTGLTNVSGNTVQEVIESIDSQISAFTANDVQGYEHVQLLSSAIWVVAHGANSKRVQVSVWDNADSILIPDAVVITDMNTVTIAFASPLTGRAILLIF